MKSPTTSSASLLASLALVLFCCAATCRAQSSHTLQLFDGYNSAGNWISVDNYVDNLADLPFDDVASSVCVYRGIWLLYQNPSYNAYQLGAATYFWGDDVCGNLNAELSDQVSSVRYAGSPFNYLDDGLNIYQSDWFQGAEVFATNDQPIVTALAGSLVVTGTSYWTLYETANYNGYHVCVTPADVQSASPGFYPSASDFGFANRLVRSVRKGCYVDRKSVARPQTVVPHRFYRAVNATRDQK